MRERIFLIPILLMAACTPVSPQDPAVGPLRLIDPPPAVVTTDLGDHLGDLVTLKARTGKGRLERGQLVFPVPTADGPAVEIVVVPPLLLLDTEKFLEKFSNQEVWVIGRVTDLGGPLQVLTGDPRRLQLVAEAEGEKP